LEVWSAWNGENFFPCRLFPLPYGGASGIYSRYFRRFGEVLQTLLNWDRITLGVSISLISLNFNRYMFGLERIPEASGPTDKLPKPVIGGQGPPESRRAISDEG